MWCIQVSLTILVLLVKFFDVSLGVSEPQNLKKCICVPYWQCKEDYSGLVQDGTNIMDVRVLKNDQEPNSCTGEFDVCCKKQCGYRNVNVQNVRTSTKFNMGTRILGEDSQAKFGEFPWMLGILENKRYRCGASLIHPQVAITAAHCVDIQGVYKIRAGEWNWESLDEPILHQDRMIKNIIIHPNYYQNALYNDIALLFLEAPFELSENVGVICVPPLQKTYDYSRCIATGWGKNSFSHGTYQHILKKITLPILPNDQCAGLLRNSKLGGSFNLHESFICAGGEDNKDTCKGDGGGPLICPVVGQHERYEQVGIVSWGLSCGVFNYPGVYVNVGMFSEWIDGEMTKNNLDINIYKSY